MSAMDSMVYVVREHGPAQAKDLAKFRPEYSLEQVRYALHNAAVMGLIHRSGRNGHFAIYSHGPKPVVMAEPIKRHALDTCWANGASADHGRLKNGA